jgi:predicted acyl esterase
MRIFAKHVLILPVFIMIMATHAARAADSYAIATEFGVEAKMRDGVTLRADVYRPKAAQEKFPVLLERTPYDKHNSTAFAVRAAAHGYVVIIQDVRGRYSSDGDWYPFKNESNDGYDTVEWAAALPYSNGKVGMIGGSYVGATQMLTAIAHPPPSPESAPSSPPATTTKAGPTRGALSNNGSTNPGPRASHRTR